MQITKWTVSGLRSRIQSIFRFWGSCVELATAEHMGHSSVTPSDGDYSLPISLTVVFFLRTSAIQASLIALGLASVHDEKQVTAEENLKDQNEDIAVW